MDRRTFLKAMGVMGQAVDDDELGPAQGPTQPTQQPQVPQAVETPIPEVAPPPVAARPSDNAMVTAGLSQLIHGNRNKADFAQSQEVLDSARIAEVGNMGDIQSEGLRAEADKLGELSGRQDVYLKGAEAEKARQDTRQLKYEADQDKAYQQLVAKLDEKPKESGFLKAMEVIAMIGAVGNGSLSEGGKGAMLAGMIRGKMGEAAQRLAGEQDTLEKKLKAAGYMYDSSASAEQNEINASQSMINMLGAAYEAPLKQIEKMRLSEEVKSTARQAQGILAQERLNATRALYEKQQAAAAAAAKQKRSSTELQFIDRMSPEERQRFLDTGSATPAQRKYIFELQDRGTKAGSQALADEKLRADIEKEKNPNKPLTEGQKKLDIQVAGAQNSYQRLQPYVTGEKSLPAVAPTSVMKYIPDVAMKPDSAQYHRDVLAMLAAVLRGESGANIPMPEVELKANAQGLFSTDPAVRQEGLKQLTSQFQAMDVTGRLGTAPAAPQQAQQASPAPAVDPYASVRAKR